MTVYKSRFTESNTKEEESTMSKNIESTESIVETEDKVVKEEIQSQPLFQETPNYDSILESQILLLNEILTRTINLEQIVENMSKQKEVMKEQAAPSNKKIIVNRDADGKIIGAEIVEGDDN